ncbi:hypothetical protein BJX64DRAFT_254503 [Aspergillus heterothallicus]
MLCGLALLCPKLPHGSALGVSDNSRPNGRLRVCWRTVASAGRSRDPIESRVGRLVGRIPLCLWGRVRSLRLIQECGVDMVLIARSHGRWLSLNGSRRKVRREEKRKQSESLPDIFNQGATQLSLERCPD